ncbi:DUF397 domain-containing protein [Streptomyces pathocidini]|uniref:DUF397 domain-containing protein n=1 Tax=Streptomyces pathocidini TaxID=1650571 RepID=UPI0033D0A57C
MSSSIQWQKSSFSGGENTACVEIGTSAAGLHLRESDDPEVVITTDRPRLAALIREIKSGAYDTP